MSHVGLNFHVLFVAVVVVDRDIAGDTVLDLARRVRKRVPDGWTFAVLVPRALDLVRRRGDAPVEARREPRQRAARLRLTGLLGECRGRRGG